jgi:hypothetical protein
MAANGAAQEGKYEVERGDTSGHTKKTAKKRTRDASEEQYWMAWKLAGPTGLRQHMQAHGISAKGKKLELVRRCVAHGDLAKPPSAAEAIPNAEKKRGGKGKGTGKGGDKPPKGKGGTKPLKAKGGAKPSVETGPPALEGEGGLLATLNNFKEEIRTMFDERLLSFRPPPPQTGLVVPGRQGTFSSVGQAEAGPGGKANLTFNFTFN